jgi:hypothetical protein
MIAGEGFESYEMKVVTSYGLTMVCEGFRV